MKIELGAKSALKPHQSLVIAPYIDKDIKVSDLSIPNVITIHAERTFWDKIVITHELRIRYKKDGKLRQDGQRISRHYYDLHSLLETDVGNNAIANLALGEDCVGHARTFFKKPNFVLTSAVPGKFALRHVGNMIELLRRDYDKTRAMIFRSIPDFDQILSSIGEIEDRLNAPEQKLGHKDN